MRIRHLSRAATVDFVARNRIRAAVGKFISRAPLEESTLIFDGPGIGLCTTLWVLAYLGPERLSRLKAIHSLSGSAFSLFWYYAKTEGQLLLTPETATRYYLENQKARGVRPGLTLFRVLFQKLFLHKWVHPNSTLADCLKGTVTEAYLNKPLSQWPENVCFWTFDAVAREFVELSKQGPYPEFPSGALIQATTAIPGIFEPFHYRNACFIDSLRAPGIKDQLKKLRSDSSNLLFLHMHHAFESPTSIYVKAHSDPSGLRRLLWDYFIWISGVKNREFGEAFRHGLFEIEPIANRSTSE